MFVTFIDSCLSVVGGRVMLSMLPTEQYKRSGGLTEQRRPTRDHGYYVIMGPCGLLSSPARP